ncbi:uncharacterized protein [Cebidichthys violaceus]|uniref:uncharacterized protein n=1 Tax=Cebidichthys violaceus TaxID=271503 RepID=UPI0035CB7A8B
MQARGQTTLFGGSIACNCGFHAVMSPADVPQSVASASAPPGASPQSMASAPGATASAPQSFLRPTLTLSMFAKSHFGGSQSASLKPNLVARTPSPSPPPSPFSVMTPSPAPSPVRTLFTAPSLAPPPSSVRTPSLAPPPSPSSVRTPSPAACVSTSIAVDACHGCRARS